jgi:hypothetical protein
MRLPRRPREFALISGVVAAALALVAPRAAHATNHIVQASEVAAAVDGVANAAFVEIQPLSPEQVLWGPGQFNGSNGQIEASSAKLVFMGPAANVLGEFSFPHDAPFGSAFVLIGTQAYKDLTNRPDPDFLIPAGLVVPGGQVCFRNSLENIFFTINSCLTVPMMSQAITPTASGLPRVTTCPSGFVQCSNVCVSLQLNEANCGMCGRACAAGETCASGTCQPPPCPVGQARCGTVCVNTATDNNNCGTCGRVCGAGTSCSGGTCQSACPAGQSLCGGVCVNPSTDNNNCGTCGKVCGAGSSCTSGTCQSVCSMGQTFCGGSCVNTSTDNNNCGTCGKICAGGASCNNGSCQVACGAGLTSCGTACLDVGTDPNNCGSCGNVCSSGTCRGGMCQARVVGDAARGRVLFTQETFGGNGRTCASCHVLDNGGSGGLSPANIALRFAAVGTTFDPLFLAETNMNLNTLTLDTDVMFANGATLTSMTSAGQASAKVLARKNPFDGKVLLVYGGITPKLEVGGTITDGTSMATIVAFKVGDLDKLENPSKMRTSTSASFPQGRGLILENIDANLRQHPADTNLFVFRKSPHIQNLRFTAPFGFSDDVADLGDFAEGAVIQHFPRSLARRVKGSAGVSDDDADFRLPTAQEKADMKAFMESSANDSIPGATVAKFNVGNFARTESQRRGLQLFRSTGFCTLCHIDQGDPSNPVFSNPIRFNTGVSNQPINKAGADNLPTEPVNQMISNRAISVPGLFNVKRNAPLFHDASAAKAEDAVRFYTTQPFRDAFGLTITLTDPQIKDVAAFLESLVSRGYSVSSAGTDVTAENSKVDLGNVVVGQTSASKIITVTNTSGSAIHFNAVSVTGASAADFAIVANGLSGTDLAPMASADITVTFKPTSAGAKTAILELSTDDPTGVDLSGTGTPNNDNGAPNLDFSQDSGGMTPAGFTLQRGGTFVASGGQLRMTSSAMPIAPNGNVLTHSFELPESFTFTVDAIATATASNVNDFSVIFNFKDINNYYYASFNEFDGTTTDDVNTNGIFKVVNGVRTQIRDFSTVTAPGDANAALLKIRVEKIRQTIRVFRGNTLMGVVTDSTFKNGKAGVGSFNDSGRFDNFVIRPHLLSEDFTAATSLLAKFLGGTFTVTGGKFQLTAAANNSTLANSNVAVHMTDVPGDFDLFVDGFAPASAQTNDDFTVVFNFQNVTNYMFVNFGEKDEATANGIFKVVNSVRTKIGTFGTTLTAPGTARRIRLTRAGGTIKVTRDGTQIGPTVTDSTFTGGKVGVGSRNNNATFDNIFVEKN